MTGEPAASCPRPLKGRCSSCGSPCRRDGHLCINCYQPPRPERRCRTCQKVITRTKAYCSNRCYDAVRSSPSKERILRRIVALDDGCWLWLGALNSYGYGEIIIDGRRTSTHRLAYELWNGPIPDGLELDHLCRVRHCVNPDHLEAVTRAENVLRGVSPPALNARKTHCVHGHEYTPENTRIRNGNRCCYACRLEQGRRHDAKRRQKR